MESQGVNEHGVSMKFSGEVPENLIDKNVTKRIKLSSSRGIALCCLSSLRKQIPGTVSALDVTGSFGLAGIQWVKHMGAKVEVTINTTKGLQQHVQSCLQENGCSINRDTVTVISEDPHILMHQKKFMFIYIEAYGPAVTYLDAAMRSINHNGLLLVTSTDTSILQNKSPSTATRLYGANLWKSEYHKEMGARVIIGSLCRAAARWQKGVKVELCMGLEHGITVVCRVLKGSKFAETSVSGLQQLIHCQLCQAREFLPENFHIAVNFSKQLCECGTDGLTAPLLLLGPMWSKNIFNKTYLLHVLKEANDLNLKKEQKLLELMIIECMCCISKSFEDDVVKEINNIINKKEKEDNFEPSCKKSKYEIYSNICIEESSEVKLSTGNTISVVEHCVPPFYFDFQYHSIKGTNPPSLCSVINKLRDSGHRASKTHFGPRCIRTSANLKLFREIMQQIWDESSKKNS